jgi:hypothetical protein
MTLLMVPGMYLIAERLKRPMRNMFGGKWVSFLGLLPIVAILLAGFMPWPITLVLLLAFPIMMFVTSRIQKRKVKRRRKKLQSNSNVNNAFVGSWL